MQSRYTRFLPAAALAVLAAACASNPQPEQRQPAPPMAQRGPGGYGDNDGGGMRGRGMGMRGGGMMGMMRNPVQLLVDSAQSLGLSADQVRQLQGIAGQLDQQNREPLDSLQAHRGEMAGMRGGGEPTPEQRAAMERLRPYMMQLRDNDRQAIERAMAVLTPDQQARVRAMMPQRRMGGGGPGGPPQP